MSKRLAPSKLLLALLVSGYLFYCALHQADSHYIDGGNLIFHEAGQTISIFFGEFIRILAGSAFQVIVPLFCAGYFAFKSDYFSAGVVLIWAGESIVNVSVYMGDAAAMNLPLLGGDAVIHDWNYILSGLNLLEYARPLSLLTQTAGMSAMLFGAVIAVVYSFVPETSEAVIRENA